MKKVVKLLCLLDVISVCYANMSDAWNEVPKRPDMKSESEIDIASATSDIIKEFGFYVAEKKISLKSYGKIKLTDYKLAAPIILLEAPAIYAGNCEFQDIVYINGAFSARNVKVKNMIINNAGNMKNFSIGSRWPELNTIKDLPIILLKDKSEIDYIEFMGPVPGIVLASKGVVVNEINNGSLLSYPMCNFCDAEVQLQLCSRCKGVYYCNRECQKAHWKHHKPECDKAVAERVKFSTYMTLLAKMKKDF